MASPIKTETTPTRYDIIREWLQESIVRAAEDAADNHTDINSYGSGYDKGYLAGLKAVRDFLNGDLDG